MAGIVMNFREKEYRIPEEKAFAVGEEVEDIVSLSELMSWGKEPRFHKIARCYGVMLRAAGAKVSDREVHTDMMDQIKAFGAAGADAEAVAGSIVAAQAVGALIAVLMDGAPAGGDAAPGKPTAS
jgi:hypothetical protein